MEDINSKILQQGYGVKLISSHRARTGLICNTDIGTLELKKTFSDDVRLEAELKLKDYLMSNDFYGLDKMYRTIDGMPSFKFDESVYILIEYSPARRMDLEDKSDIKEMAETLAYFHNAAEGFDDDRIRRTYGLLESGFHKRMGELTRIRKRIKSFGDYSQVDLTVIKYYDYYMERLNQAIELLKKSNYSDILRKVEENKSICHNTFKNDNVKKNEKDEIVISGLDGCTYDISILDLADLIRKYVKSDLADEEGLFIILNSYNDKRVLSASERDIIKGMLIYPHKFLKLCNEHYNKRRVCISEASIERFNNCVKHRHVETMLALFIQS